MKKRIFMLLLLVGLVLGLGAPVLATDAVDFYDNFDGEVYTCYDKNCDWEKVNINHCTGEYTAGDYSFDTTDKLWGSHSIKFSQTFDSDCSDMKAELYLVADWNDLGGSYKHLTTEGSKTWYGISFFVPSTFTTLESPEWFVMEQWHAIPDSSCSPVECESNPPIGTGIGQGSPANLGFSHKGQDDKCCTDLALACSGGAGSNVRRCKNFDVNQSGTLITGMTKGQWYNLVVGFKTEWDNTAWIKAYIDGTLVYNYSSTMVGFNDDYLLYYLIGVYAGDFDGGEVQVVNYDEFRIGRQNSKTDAQMIALVHPPVPPSAPTMDTDPPGTCGGARCLYDGDTNVDVTQAWTVESNDVGYSETMDDGQGVFSHYGSDWRLCEDAACTKILYYSYNDTSNKTSWELPANTIPRSLTSYVQHRYISWAGDIDRNGNGTSAASDSDDRYPGAWSTISFSGAGNSWPEDWEEKVVLTIDADGGDYLPNLCSSGTVAYLPIPLTPDNFPPHAIDTDDPDYATKQAQADCGDLRAYAGDYGTWGTDPATENTNRLALEVVSCTHGDYPDFQVWVEVPSVSCTTDTKITIYYNATGKVQPAENAAYGAQDVWNDGLWGAGNNWFKGVWHMEEASGTLYDSTQYSNDLSTYGGTPRYQMDGVIGYGIAVESASSEYFYKAGWSSITTTPMTLETFARVNDPDDTTFNAFIVVADTATSQNWYVLDMECDVSENCYTAASSHGGTYRQSKHTTKLWALGNLHYAGVFTSNTSRRVYFNGIPGPENTGDDSVVSGVDSLSIGARRLNTVDGYHFGTLDEVRVSAKDRPQNYLEATAHILREPKFYITGGNDPPNPPLNQQWEPWYDRGGGLQGAVSQDTSGKKYLENFADSLSSGNRKPFFWAADTAWNLPYRLTLTEAAYYLQDRAEKGFNVLLVTTLGGGYEEYDYHVRGGVGQRTWTNGNPTTPNESFFSHFDNIIDLAGKYGMYLLIVTNTAGHFDPGETLFDDTGCSTSYTNCAKARTWGQYLGNRYKDVPNILWMQGGDFAPNIDGNESLNKVRAVAEGIQDYDNNHPQTYHPNGGTTQTTYTFYDVDVNLWFDFHGSQATRLSWQKNHTIPPVVGGDAPYYFFEPCYDAKGTMDNGLDSCGPLGFDAYMYRTSFWLTFLRGARGYTWGSRIVHPFHIHGITGDRFNMSYPYFIASGYTRLYSWRKAIDNPYYQWAEHAIALWKNIRYWKMVPEKGWAGTGSAIIDTNRNDADERYEKHASYSSEGDLIMVWFPGGCTSGCTSQIDPTHYLTESFNYKATWWKSTDGSLSVIGTYSVASGARNFTPPDETTGYMLLLESTGDKWYVSSGCTNSGDGTDGACAGSPGGVGAFKTFNDVNSAIDAGEAGTLDSFYFKSGETFQGTDGSYSEKLWLRDINGESSAKTFDQEMVVGCYWMDGGSENHDCIGNSKPKPWLKGNRCGEAGADVPDQDAYEGLITVANTTNYRNLKHLKIEQLKVTDGASNYLIDISGPQANDVHGETSCKAEGKTGGCEWDCTDITVQDIDFERGDNQWLGMHNCHDSEYLRNTGLWANYSWWTVKYEEYHNPPYTGSCQLNAAAGYTITGGEWQSYNNRMAYSTAENCKECFGIGYLADDYLDCSSSPCVPSWDGAPDIHNLAEWNVIKTGYGVPMYPADGGNRGATVRYNWLFELGHPNAFDPEAPQDRWTGILADNEDSRNYCSWNFDAPIRIYGNIVAGLDNGKGAAISCEYCYKTQPNCWAQVHGYVFQNTFIENEDNFSYPASSGTYPPAGGNSPTIYTQNNLSQSSEAVSDHFNATSHTGTYYYDGNAFNDAPCTPPCDKDDGAEIGNLYIAKSSGWYTLPSEPGWYETRIDNPLSKGFDTANALTTVHVRDKGTGTRLEVANSWYFHGDEKIAIGSPTNVATISSIERYGKPGVIILTGSVSRSDGQSIWLNPANWELQQQMNVGYIGAGPDAGAIERWQDAAPPISNPGDGETGVSLTPNMQISRAILTNNPLAHDATTYKICQSPDCSTCTAYWTSSKDESNLTSITTGTLLPLYTFYACERTFGDYNGDGYVDDYDAGLWRETDFTTGGGGGESYGGAAVFGAGESGGVTFQGDETAGKMLTQ